MLSKAETSLQSAGRRSSCVARWCLQDRGRSCSQSNRIWTAWIDGPCVKPAQPWSKKLKHRNWRWYRFSYSRDHFEFNMGKSCRRITTSEFYSRVGKRTQEHGQQIRTANSQHSDAFPFSKIFKYNQTVHSISRGIGLVSEPWIGEQVKVQTNSLIQVFVRLNQAALQFCTSKSTTAKLKKQ